MFHSHVPPDDLLNDLNTSKTAPAKRTSLQPQAARSQGSSSTSGSRPSAAPGVVPKSPSFAWADAESELDAIANALSPASQSNQNGQAELDAYGTHAGHGTSSYDEQQPPAEEWQQYEAPPEYLQQRSRAPSNAQQPQRTSRPPSMGSGTVPRSPAITSSAHDNLRQLVDNRPNGSRPEMAPRPSMAKSASGAANNREPQATCRACSKPILNPPVIKVAQGTYHADHFRCAGCNNQLQASGTGYFERQSKLWCESCAKELKYPRCAFCNEDITGVCSYVCEDLHPSHLSRNFLIYLNDSRNVSAPWTRHGTQITLYETVF